MTELENQLLTAFEQLQTEHDRQHQDFVKAYNGLVKIFKITSAENQALQQSVSSLTEQVQSLSVQLQRLEKRYSKR